MPPSKPKKSDVCNQQLEQSNKLPCKELSQCNSGTKELILQETFNVLQEKSNLPRDNRDIDALNFGMSPILSDRNLSDANALIPTWAGCPSLLSGKTLPIWQVGFLSYLPYPVTKYDVLFTALYSLANVANELQQHCHFVFCGEGVYCIVIEIFLKQLEHFQNLVPITGGFQMAKSAVHCVGKYLRGSGVEDAFVDTETFGLKVAQSVMEGSHYVRAFRCLLSAAEAVESMIWDAFWNVPNREEYTIEQSALRELSSSLMEKDLFTTKAYLNLCRKNEKLMHDFYIFFAHVLDASSMCKYWNGFIDNVNCIKVLIAANRTGDWEEHLDAIENLLPIFCGCGSTNYLCYATFYLASMRRLPTDHRAIYETFMKGYFVINESHRKFSCVSPGMKLEQTMQHAQKISSGIIWQTRWISYMSKLEVVYHEILAISNTFRRLTNSTLGASESEVS